ncbi:hypothetical protein B0H10DRAFT_2214329 [Mycena sp. CBHHK59/15]|nr:hypothetical protein B0H10DRAFT_2214329 [Mycena sp. CBHHK59/15]
MSKLISSSFFAAEQGVQVAALCERGSRSKRILSTAPAILTSSLWLNSSFNSAPRRRTPLPRPDAASTANRPLYITPAPAAPMPPLRCSLAAPMTPCPRPTLATPPPPPPQFPPLPKSFRPRPRIIAPARALPFPFPPHRPPAALRNDILRCRQLALPPPIATLNRTGLPNEDATVFLDPLPKSVAPLAAAGEIQHAEPSYTNASLHNPRIHQAQASCPAGGLRILVA